MIEKLVSVIIPSFKMGQFIGEALESVGAQTYPHWEVIVVDDAGPEDGTRAAVEAFAAKHSDHRVEYIRHETNQGVSVARRTGAIAAKGEFIAFLDADDSFLPGKLAQQLAAMQRFPSVVLCHGPAVVVGGSAAESDAMMAGFSLEATGSPYKLREKPYALGSNYICLSTVLCRRACVGDDCFPRNMVYQFEDWYMWLRLSAKGAFVSLDSPVTRYSLHEDGFTTRTMRNPQRQVLARLEMLAGLISISDSPAWLMRVGGAIFEQLLLLARSRSSGGPEAWSSRSPMVAVFLASGVILGFCSGVWNRVLGRRRQG